MTNEIDILLKRIEPGILNTMKLKKWSASRTSILLRKKIIAFNETFI